jgi:hypothetical protein
MRRTGIVHCQPDVNHSVAAKKQKRAAPPATRFILGFATQLF